MKATKKIIKMIPFMTGLDRPKWKYYENRDPYLVTGAAAIHKLQKFVINKNIEKSEGKKCMEKN